MSFNIAHTKTQKSILLLGCIAMIFIVRPWQLYFLNDDFLHIPPSIRYLFNHGGFMRPVPNIFVEIDKWIYGKNATGFFVTSLLLHTACVFTVYAFMQKLRSLYFAEQRYTLLPFLTAFLFLFYPFHGEALMWVIARVTIITTLFTMASFYFYLSAGQNRWHLLFAWLCFVVALFTYESMWNAPLLFFLLSFIRVRTSGNDKKVFKAEAINVGVMFATFLAYLFVRMLVLHSVTGDGYEKFEDAYNVTAILTNIVKLFARVFTPPAYQSTIPTTIFIASLILYAVLVLLSFRKDKKAGILSVLLWIALFTGIITAAPLGIDTHRNESDRYLFYASFFFCAFIALMICLFINKNTVRFIITCIYSVASISILLSYQKNYAYASAVTRTTTQFVQQYPNHAHAYFTDIPKARHGSLIFRISLANGIRWIWPDCNYTSISMCSQVNNASGILPFRTGEKTWGEFAAAKQIQSVLPIITDSLQSPRLIERKDILFWYTDSGLYKINIPDSLYKPLFNNVQ